MLDECNKYTISEAARNFIAMTRCIIFAIAPANQTENEKENPHEKQ